jgi:hypothetical protein
MSGATPIVRGRPSRSVVPFSGSAMPASMVGEPGAYR